MHGTSILLNKVADSHPQHFVGIYPHSGLVLGQYLQYINIHIPSACPYVVNTFKLQCDLNHTFPTLPTGLAAYPISQHQPPFSISVVHLNRPTCTYVHTYVRNMAVGM